jgi:histidyl-tRNA synthetase
VGQTVEPGSFKKLMKDAERSGARRYVLVGEREALAGVAMLRDAAGGEQREIALDHLADVLRAGGSV